MKAPARGFLLAVVLVIGSWISVEAQVRPGSVFPEPGSQVRGQIRVENGNTTFEGFLVSSSPSELEIRTLESDLIRVESASLAALEVRGHSSGAGAGKGWKIGAVVTGALGALSLAGYATENRPLAFVIGGVIGAIPGALVGALVGAAVGAESWERVW
jgi:hypothetical protein